MRIINVESYKLFVVNVSKFVIIPSDGNIHVWSRFFFFGGGGACGFLFLFSTRASIKFTYSQELGKNEGEIWERA